MELLDYLGAVPLLWLCALQLRGAARGALWWGLAAAFCVSSLADAVVHYGIVDQLVVSASYPIVQVALIGAVLLSRTDALVLAWALCLVGAFAGLWEDPKAPDLFLRTVACGAVVGIVWQRHGLSRAWPWPELRRARMALLVTFGLGWVAWVGYAAWRGWPSYIVMEAVRLAGTALFCWACTTTRPPMPVARFAMLRTAHRL